jgi:hypothetical protein
MDPEGSQDGDACRHQERQANGDGTNGIVGCWHGIEVRPCPTCRPAARSGPAAAPWWAPVLLDMVVRAHDASGADGPRMARDVLLAGLPDDVTPDDLRAMINPHLPAAVVALLRAKAAGLAQPKYKGL